MQTIDHGQHQDIRDAVRALCADYPAEYHRRIDEARGYPEEFVDALTKAGWMAALIPEEYGGSGLGLTEASVIMEEINRSGGNSGACHGQMYNMNTLVRHGSEEQRQRYLPKIAAGELRLQSMGVTEPTAGTDTTRIKTMAVKKGDRYVINGQKVWISRIQHSDLMILLARTTPLDQVKKIDEDAAVDLLTRADVAFASVNDMAALSNHPHLRRIEVDTPAGKVGFPAPAPIFKGGDRHYGPVPGLGEHRARRCNGLIREAAMTTVPMGDVDVGLLRSWIGREEEERREVVTEDLAAKFHATLDLPSEAPRRGEQAPRLIHHCLTPQTVPDLDPIGGRASKAWRLPAAGAATPAHVGG